MARNTAHSNAARQQGLKLLFGLCCLLMLSIVWKEWPTKRTHSPTQSPTVKSTAVLRGPGERPKRESEFEEELMPEELTAELPALEEWEIAPVPPPGPLPDHDQTPDRQTVRLLVYNELEWHLNSPGAGECAVECQVTYERDAFDSVDVVLFSAPLLDAEVLENSIKPEDQVWVGLCMGPRSDEQCKRMHAELDGRIDLISSYKPKSDIPAFFYVPPAPLLWRAKPIGSVDKPHELAALLSSTCDREAAPERFALLTGLMKHLALGVASYGECFHNSDLPEHSEDFDEKDPEYSEFSFTHTKKVVEAISRHKFLLVFENHDSRYYHTDKFWLAYQAGAVPVYWGHSTIVKGRYGPGPGSFVYARDYSSARELAKELERIAANDDRYQSYFRWKRQSVTMPYQYHKDNDVSNLACNICKKVLEEDEQASIDEEA